MSDAPPSETVPRHTVPRQTGPSHTGPRHTGPRYARWLALAALLGLAVVLYRHYGLGRLLTLDALKHHQQALQAFYQTRPVSVLAGFFGLYVAATALSVPGATVLTLAAGAMFGLWVGLLLASFASSIGALLAFLGARYLLRDSIQARFGRKLGAINDGMQRDGAFYLLTLRLVPLFPFVLVNLLAGLTPIAAGRFYAVSQLGMLAGTAVYVNAGAQLAHIRSLSDVFSPSLLASFALLGVLPLVGKGIVAALRRRKVYAGWGRPRRFDRNLIVIGAGAGGLVTSYIAAAVRARVTLVEGHKMGGDCLNSGCVPSKALIRSARLAQQIRGAAAFGLRTASAEVDFAAVMARVQQVIHAIEPHDSVARYTGLGVDVVQGRARITSPWQVEITGGAGGNGPPGHTQTLTTRSIVIATGASPVVPPLPGLADVGCLTSDTVWGLTALPGRLVVLGGGPIGCELAQSFARLGAQVTLVEMSARILQREDPEAAALVAAALQVDGVRLLTNHAALRCERDGDIKRLFVRPGEASGTERVIEFDQLLCAVGRTPRVTGFGLEELGVPLTQHETVETNAYLQTLFPNIYAVGDVAGPYQLTHVAGHQAWYAAVNALFGRFKRFKADYAVIPWATFTDPEVARVGLSEGEATEQGVAFEVTRFALRELDRAVTDGATEGYVKVLTVPGKDKILGASIVGPHAGDLLAEYVLAMKHGLGLNKILGTIHTYPTLAEANKSVAGEWKRRHAPQRLLAWAERYHAWQRG